MINEKERKVLEYFLKNVDREKSVADIARVYYGPRKRPEQWRGSVLAFMRQLCWKCAALKLPQIERVSRLGCGSPVVYCLPKHEAEKATGMEMAHEREQCTKPQTYCVNLSYDQARITLEALRAWRDNREDDVREFSPEDTEEIRWRREDIAVANEVIRELRRKV